MVYPELAELVRNSAELRNSELQNSPKIPIRGTPYSILEQRRTAGTVSLEFVVPRTRSALSEPSRARWHGFLARDQLTPTLSRSFFALTL